MKHIKLLLHPMEGRHICVSVCSWIGVWMYVCVSVGVYVCMYLYVNAYSLVCMIRVAISSFPMSRNLSSLCGEIIIWSTVQYYSNMCWHSVKNVLMRRHLGTCNAGHRQAGIGYTYTNNVKAIRLFNNELSADRLTIIEIEIYWLRSWLKRYIHISWERWEKFTMM